VLLRDHLTDSNHEDLLGEASGKTKREVQGMLAARFPKPDVPSSIRRLPSSNAASQQASSSNVKSADETAPPATPRSANAQQSMTLALSATRYKVQFTASRGPRMTATCARPALCRNHDDHDLGR